MPIDDWSDMMPATVTLEPVASLDQYGKPSYAAAVSYRARVTYKVTRVVNMASGQDALSAGVVWFGGIPALTMDDRITLPDGTSPVILNIQQIADEEGPHHTVVYFGGADFGGSRG